MSQDNSTTASVRRVFRYGDHVFDDPGREYTVEHVKDHLSMYKKGY